MIYDCRHGNAYMKKHKFKFETLHREGRSVFDGCEYGALIDLSFAYYHIPVHPSCYKYLVFRWYDLDAAPNADGSRPMTLYCYTVLPFWIRTAPRIFSMVLKQIVQHWLNTLGMRLLQYLDDLTLGCLLYTSPSPRD